MVITDKTRKILWGRSGNRCAFCQQLLVLEKSNLDSESIVGDEAHMVSARINGPRGKVQIKVDFDDLDNLILLCKIHHKLVDDQPETYTFEFLILLKNMHEVWVEQTLSRSRGDKENTDVNFLTHIEHGKDLTMLFSGSLSFSYMYDKLDSQETEETVAIILESIDDYLSMWDDMGIGERIRLENQFDQWIALLATQDYWIFASLDPDPKDEHGNKLDNWKSFIVAIKKSTNPEIRRTNQNK